jgi:hypothetical protein
MKEFKGTLSNPVLALNWFIIVLGVSGALYSTYYSIDKMITAESS